MINDTHAKQEVEVTKTMFDVTVPMTLKLRVEAETIEDAIKQAEEFGHWTDPTDEQLDDYKSDHESGVQDFGHGGVLTVDGKSTAAIAEGNAPGFTR